MSEEPSFLARIVASRRAAVIRGAGEVRAATGRAPDGQAFLEALCPRASGRLSLIAEVKRISPARGVLERSLDPAALAAAYARGGAAALSVLTEPEFFGARPGDLEEASAASGLPVLRKDFVVDPWQVEETAAMGCDALLLMVVVLGERTGSYVELCRARGIQPMVEVHTAREMDIALESAAPLIGINNRDMASFEVDPRTARRLAPRAAAQGRTVAALSGITGPADLRGLAEAGVSAVLVGEFLMRSGDPEAAVRSLVGGSAGVD